MKKNQPLTELLKLPSNYLIILSIISFIEEENFIDTVFLG